MSGAPLITRRADPDGQVSVEEVAEIVEEACPLEEYRGSRVLVIVPDLTRTAPIGVVFRALHRRLGDVVAAMDVMIALGTHQPLNEEGVCERLEINAAERAELFRGVRFFNHEWNVDSALQPIGEIPAGEISALTNGRFAMDVPVRVNRRLFDYDRLVIIGPVFPHEVVGFSGGNKYLFPGVGGPEILNFFHWLGAVVTNPMIIGNQWTPVRKVVDRAGSMVNRPKLCLSLVVRPDKSLAGFFAGTPEESWAAASELSAKVHIELKSRPFHTIVSCAPRMYDELWVGGKCMYKLEPVLADGGELIIHAPHLREISATHGHILRQIGYHCRDYFLKQWDRFSHHPWGVLAHSCHVYGQGTYENGVETPRARVTLATGIPEELCRRINLGYRDPATLRPGDYADREQEGILMVPRAGETLYQLKQRPAWAGGV